MSSSAYARRTWSCFSLIWQDLTFLTTMVTHCKSQQWVSSSPPKWGLRKWKGLNNTMKQIWLKDGMRTQSRLSEGDCFSHLETIHYQVEVLAPGSPQSCIVLQQEEKVLGQLSCFCFYGRQREPQDPDQALQGARDHLRKQNAELWMTRHTGKGRWGSIRLCWAQHEPTE